MQVRLDKEVSKMLKAELKLQRDCNANPKSVYAGGAVSASSIANYIVWLYFRDKEEKK